MSSRLIEARKKEDRRRMEAEEMVMDQIKVKGRVEFQHRTDARIKTLVVTQKIEAANAEVRKRIDERRAKLATLLEGEKAQYEREIEATFETPEQAKARILAYARKLKDDNEAARRVLVTELEERRFRLGSDVLRGRASKIMTERVALDRVSQLHERAAALRVQAEEEAKETALLDADAKMMTARHRADIEARRRLEAEMRNVLDQQVDVKRELRMREDAWEAGEVAKLLGADRAAAEAKVKADIDSRAAARQDFARVSEFNASERGTKDKAARAEADADMADLEATLAREAAANAAAEEAHVARRREGLAAKAKLEQQMSIQAEDKGWLDEFYYKESEKEWDKRQAKWDGEAAARKSLMDDVARTRLLQMEEHKSRGNLDAEDDARQMASFRRLQAESDAKLAEQQGKRKHGLAMQAEQSRVQMEQNQRARDAARQQEYLDWRLQQKFDREYEDRVQRMLKEGLRQQ